MIFPRIRINWVETRSAGEDTDERMYSLHVSTPTSTHIRNSLKITNPGISRSGNKTPFQKLIVCYLFTQ